MVKLTKTNKKLTKNDDICLKTKRLIFSYQKQRKPRVYAPEKYF